MALQVSKINHPPELLDGPQLLHCLIEWKKHGNSDAIDFIINKQRRQYKYHEVRSCVAVLEKRIQEILNSSFSHSNDQDDIQHVIPVILPQSPGLYVSQLAILKCGGAFCPINLDAPKERIKFVVGDVDAKVLITTAKFKETVTWEGGPAVLVVDEFPTIPSGASYEGHAVYNSRPSDLAYVMYTSGSSGKPKGVGVSHLAVSQSLLAHQRHIPHFQRFLQFAAPSFDVSVFEIFFPLIRGCTLVGCNRGQLLDDLPGLINKLQVDAAELTPTVAGSLLRKRSEAPGLKLLLTIGEMLTKPVIEEFGGSETRQSMLYGMYGPTEAAIHCSINPSMAAGSKAGNIGKPFDTVSSYIAEAAETSAGAQVLKFLPMGELGELVLGGPQLARGYLNREEQNKAAFVTFNGNFYYRTGDKARFLADGTIEIHGRISAGQVKLRGQRVELGEIENAIYEHPGINSVVAAVLGGVLIVFALTDDVNLSSDDVMKTCSKWLPKFMVPSEVVLLHEFPHLPSGKVDKKQLEADYSTRRNQDCETAVLQTGTELLLKDTLEELLGPFPSNNRLAAVGLDSLMAIRLSSKLRSLGFNLTAVSILQADDLSTLAKACEDSKSSTNEVASPSSLDETHTVAILNGDAEDIEAVLQCTPLQSSMLAETIIDEKAYRNWVKLDFPGIFEADQVSEAFSALAKTNSILRTGFSESHDFSGFVQIVWKTFPNSQIEKVQDLNYAYDAEKDSMRYPPRVQVCKTESGTRLLLHIHHALYDAWSLELLLDDFDLILKSQTPTLRPPFTHIVQELVSGALLPEKWSSRDYWNDHLTTLDIRYMPNFHSKKKPPFGLFTCLVQTLIPTQLVESAAKRLSSSPQSLFQAAFALLLSSYIGSSDVCFGTVFSGRTLPVKGIEEIAGPCLATLPVRVDTSISTTLGELVQELNLTNRKHLEHSALPLRDIKSAAGIAPRQNLFDTLLIWQQTLHSYDHVREHVFLVDTVDNLEFNLTLEILPSTSNIKLKANYQQSMFPESQIKLLLAQLEQVVQLIINHNSMPLDETFSQLNSDLLSIENQPPEPMRKFDTLALPIERVASEEPERPALEFATAIHETSIDSEVVSYGELNTAANKMSHLLMSLSILPDDLVCICLEKSVELYTSILGIVKIGAGYLPVTPDIPLARLKHILQETNVKMVVSQSSLKHLFDSLNVVKVVYIDQTDLTKFSVENIPPRASPDNVSYCVFTSGSTGTPKGVLVTHGNLLSNLDVLEDLYPVSKDARLLQSCSQAFDVSVFEIFFTWRIGGCLCSATKDVLFQNIENAIRLLNITHLSLTPTVAALVDPSNATKVRFLVTAGEAVTPKVFNKWAGRGLFQGYGPSETTNICTVNPNVSPDDSINNIGPPLKNTSAFVLSPGSDFKLVPRGGEGEFCFGGAQVFRGYVDTNQNVGKIINHPTYGRLYRSGDFGRLMPDGSLAFTGRKDDQIKIRGQRVELGEINNVMLRSDFVGDCVTMVMVGAKDNSQRLVCFWTVGHQISPEGFKIVEPDEHTITKLFRALEAALPAYMIPSSLIPVSELPSTVQGKIDKRLLMSKYHKLGIDYLNLTSRSIKAPSDYTWSDLELQIAKAASQVTKLPIEEIGPETSFFSIGIDSISAISLATILRKNTAFKVIQISDILRYSSIVRLAEALSDREAVATKQPKTLEKGCDFGFSQSFIDSTMKNFGEAGKTIRNILPCTPLQEAMLSASESDVDILYYNEVVFEVYGSIDTLKSCWREMIKRHDILRTCFVVTDMPRYAYIQVVLDTHEVHFCSKHEQAKDYEPPYNLEIKENDRSVELIISMHHALYDGVALSVLYHEVEQLYREKSLPPAPPFAPFLLHVSMMNMQEAEIYWGKVLKNSAPTRFKPMYKPIKANEPRSCSRMQRTSMSQPLSWFEAHGKTYGTSLLAICQTAFAALLSERIGKNDITFGNVVSGRTLPLDDLDRLVAPCFNTVPVRLANIQNSTFFEAFRRFQNLNAESLPHQHTPLRRIQSRFSPNRSRLFDTLFILQQPPRQLDVDIWKMKEDKGAMDFPLVCEVTPYPEEDRLEVILHAYSNVISEAEAQDLLSTFENTLRTALENPRRQILSSEVKENILARQEKQGKFEAISSQITASSSEMTDDERKLRDVVAAFTDVPIEKIDRDVSIFRLGLDSISAVQVATRLRKLGYTLNASDILERPTIAQLSTWFLEDKKGNNEVTIFDFDGFDHEHRASICAKNGLNSEAIETIRPCTAVQKGMLAQTLHSGGTEYVNSMWFELLPGTSIAKLKDAWRITCESHEMLRTVFAQSDIHGYPFVMVTQLKDHSEFPWSLTNEQTDTTGASGDLLRHPWNLTVSEAEGKKTVKLSAHHALYDAQSMQMILQDVCNAYATTSVVTRPKISSLLGAIMHSSEIDPDAKKGFWQAPENKVVVNQFPDLTPLHVYEKTIQVQELHSKATVTALEEDCRKIGVTMQAATQATWARLLAMYTGEPSTTFGMTLSGRSVHDEADSIAFPSIVTLPVRCDVVGMNAELLRRTMKFNTLLHKHQFTPLTSIQRWAGYPKGKIFDTLFAYQKLPPNDEVETPWKVAREEASSDYSVSLEVQPMTSEDLVLRLTFREDIIPIEHADLLLKQYDVMLIDVLRNPAGQCDMAPEINNELLSITPAKHDKLPGEISLLHQFVEKGATNWPDRRALEFATSLQPGNVHTTSWTYSELEQEGNKVAQMLVSRGIVPGQMIAICFDKCPEASFAIIGIQKAGCAFVALDPSAPLERMKFILEDSDARLILTAGKPAQNIRGKVQVVIIDMGHLDLLTGFTTSCPVLSRQILPSDVSYCLYTSGTTGTPKGCLITHENVVQAMYSWERLYASTWDCSSKWLQFASFHFDVSVMEQFWSWSVGICVASAPRDLIFEDIPGAISLLEITHIDLTPSLARLLHPDEVPTLCKGVFVTGGEQLQQEILDVWGEKSCIYNGYGPTETTIGCTMYTRVPKNGKPSNIGPPYQNAGGFVLKPGTEFPVLRGGVGELCVSGKLVGKGYLNRPDLTEERFPRLKAFDEKVYRTGDLVRVLHNDNFIFLGRADDQVKLRGQRLELTEINEVIKKSKTRIEEVVTIVLKHSTQQKEQLVTFFVTAKSNHIDDTAIRISQMRDACKARLPGYMVPTHFVPVERIPLNANNKADSKQLAAMYDNISIYDLQILGQSSQTHQAWTSEEEKVISVIAGAIHVDKAAVKRNSTIFELGIDSISIIGFARKLEESGFTNAKLSLVKSNPSIDGLVVALLQCVQPDQGQNNCYDAATQRIAAFAQKHLANICVQLDIDSQEVEYIAPCTPVQEGMVYKFLESDTALYFNQFNFNLKAGIDMRRLRKAWEKVISKLEVLRTKFVETDDGYAQVVLRKNGDSWGFVEIDYIEHEKEVALKQPFVIELKSTSAGNRMSLRVFHGLYDGNSMTMMLRCVIKEYRKVDNAGFGPSFLSSLPYGPLAQNPAAKEFWTEHLQSWTSCPLPTTSATLTDTVVSLDITNITGFEAMRTQLGVSHQAIMQAIWVSVLQELVSAPTIGIVISGRAIDFPDAEKVIGPLFNTVPFHPNLELDMTAMELIKQCHTFNMLMQDHQHTPLKDIQKWSPARESGKALFDSLFVFQMLEEVDEGYADGVWELLDNSPSADYHLALEFTMSPGCDKLDLIIVAQGNVVNKVAARDILRKIQTLLLDTLASKGKNVILMSHKGSRETESSISTGNETLNSANFKSSFIWTDEAQSLRREIATLADVSEDSVKEYSSVFELGLDSIDVIKLSSRLRKRGIQLPVSVIIKCQTVAQIVAKGITATNLQLQTSPGSSVVQMSHDLEMYLESTERLLGDIEAILPATPLQQSMVNEMIKSDYHRYFNIEVFKLSEDVDVERLTKAVRAVIKQTPILRTSFVMVDDPKLAVSYAQLIHTYESKYVDSIVGNKTLQSGHELEQFVKDFEEECRVSARKAQRMLHLAFLDTNDEHYLVMAISHALYDGASLRNLHEDIMRSYNGKLEARPDSAPFLEEVFRSTTKEAEFFWKSTLAKLPPTKLPRKNPSEFMHLYRFEKQSSIPVRKLEALCKSSRITMQTIGQTCWSLVLSYLMGQLDVVFGSVLSCRDSEEAREVMFPLMNTVAVRSVLHGTLEEMLRYMQNMSDSIRQYQHFPLGTAQAYALASRRTQDEKHDTNLFDTLFIYQGRRPVTQGQQLYTAISGTSDVEFPVCIEMEIVSDEHLTWTIACRSIACSEKEATQLGDCLDAVLKQVVNSPRNQTMQIDNDKVSVCGLPYFTRASSKPEINNNTAAANTAKNDEWSETENNIRKALSELSDIPEETIEKSNTIFHLGLDSILALKLPALLRKYDISIAVSTILREQTIAAMAKGVAHSEAETEAFDTDNVLEVATSSIDMRPYLVDLELKAGDIQEILPVTAGQLFTIRQWQISRGALFYSTFIWSLPMGRVNKARLDKAWRQLTQRHDILRTGFVEVDQKLVQVVFKFPQNDVIYGSRKSAPIKRLDLDFPPVNLILEEGKESDAVLKLVIHHALYDGVSLPILMQELRTLYEGKTIELTRFQFRDFVAKSIDTSNKSARNLWTSYFQIDSTYRFTQVEIDNERTEIYRPGMVFSIDLRQRAQASGISIDALFLSAIAKLEAQRLQQKNSPQQVVIGIYLANRAPFGEDLSSFAAPTLNLLPLLVKNPLSITLDEMAKSIQKDLQKISSKEMSSTSLKDIYDWTGIRVECFVNIMKNTTGHSKSSTEGFELIENLGEKKSIVLDVTDERIVPPAAGAGAAFPPSIDIELRYQDGKIDMGIFGPRAMLGVDEADGIIDEFMKFWR